MSTVRSHYLPRTYLKHFLHEDKLFMYKKGEKFFQDSDALPEERILEVKGESGLLNIGVEKHLYDPEIEGVSPDDLETIFQELGESSYDATIQEIEKLPSEAVIPAQIKDSLSIFMASMRVRTPLFKHEIEEMSETMTKHLMAADYKRMSVEEIKENSKKIVGEEITTELAKNIKDSFTNQEYNLEYPNAYFIKYALLMLEEHASVFHQMTMTICESDGRFFITNDSPFVNFVPPEHVNVYNSPKALVSQHSEAFFPLTKNLAVHLCWKKDRERKTKISRKVVDIFNYNLAHNSFNYIFAPLKINELVKFTEEHIPYPFKITMS